jgi:hypothetical protein
MAINEMPCGKCVHYDPRLGSNYKDTKRGNCIMRAKYPYKEGPGQLFPPNAQRVGKSELAQPFLVKEEQVVPMCTDAKLSGVDDPAEAKRKAIFASQEDNQGRRVVR